MIVVYETGRSPQTMYAVLRAHARSGHLPPGTTSILQLDEYAGLAPTDGRILRRTAEPNELAAPGKTILAFGSDTEGWLVRAGLPR